MPKKTNTPTEYRPDPQWSQSMVNVIVRCSGRSLEEIDHVEINCGNAPIAGWVVLKTGEKISV